METEGNNYLLIDMHHIISDGVSMAILVKEFISIYDGQELKPLRLQYKDFAKWQNEYLISNSLKNQEEYWLNCFSDDIPVLNMPTDYERPPVQSFEGDSISFELEEGLAQKLKNITKTSGCTMQMVLLSAFNILLSKYSGAQDLIIGIPISGRYHADLQNIIGLFVNTLALRNKPEVNKKYADFLNEVKINSLQSYENQSYQLEALVEKLNLNRDMSRNPLFDVVFNMVEDATLNKSYNDLTKISKFDLTLTAADYMNRLSFNLQYSSKLFKKERIERMSKHYIKILETIAMDMDIVLNDIDILLEEEKNILLNKFNSEQIFYEKEKTLQELFEEQVRCNPNNVAVVFEGASLTYTELNERANSLAVTLRNRGVKSDSIVAIMVDRSLEMIIGIMGVIKAGGAYLPIDTSYPKERVEYILKDSQSTVLLSKTELLKNIYLNIEVLDLFTENSYSRTNSNLERINTSSDLAYVIYTSGTSGNPKGVMIEHRSVNNLVQGLNKNIYSRYRKVLKVALISPFYFDASVKQIFAALLNGHSLYIVDEDSRRNGEKLIKFYEENIIDIADGTPMHLKMMLSSKNIKGNKLKVMHYVIGGEKLSLNEVKEFYKYMKDDNKPNISNVYGPTECCVDASIFLIDSLKLR